MENVTVTVLGTSSLICSSCSTSDRLSSLRLGEWLGDGSSRLLVRCFLCLWWCLQCKGNNWVNIHIWNPVSYGG